MAIKVRAVTIDGVKRVPPEVMDLLIRMGHHRDFCPQCASAMETGTGDYCPIGTDIIIGLERQPEVEFIPEPK